MPPNLILAKKKNLVGFFFAWGSVVKREVESPPPQPSLKKKNWIPHALDAKVVGMAEKQIIDNEYYRVLGQQ